MVIAQVHPASVAHINYTDERFYIMFGDDHGSQLPSGMWPSDGELPGRNEHRYTYS